MPRWWHDEPGRAWLDALPDLVASQCRTWGLTVDGSPWHGSNALVVPVLRGGLRLALRLAPPGDDVDAEARALRFWDGGGTVLLHEVDSDARAMLLERLDGEASLEATPLAEAVVILGDLTRTLAVPAPVEVTSTSEIAGGMIESLEPQWREIGSPVPWAQIVTVLEAAQRRAKAEEGALAVNGDLHFGQVLRGSRAPWLVVDPVLLRGDREYDLGRVLWSRMDEVGSDAQIESLFHAFVEAAQVPADRARDWVLIRAASYLIWGLRHGLTYDPPKCQRLLGVFSRRCAGSRSDEEST